MVRIISVKIDAFGNLNGYKRTFDEGLNTILGDNSTGKTTMLGFIRCMFYGLGDKKYLGIDKQRDMYRPWHMDKRATFGGSMQFEWDCSGQVKQYSITRKFGSTAKTDWCQLVQLDTGEAWDNINNLGEKIFGFNIETFERSIFVHQEQTTITGDSGELASRLSRMVDGQGDHQLALDKLDKSRKTFVLTGNRGNNNALISQIAKLEDDISVAHNNLVVAQSKTEQLQLAQDNKQSSQTQLEQLRAKHKQLSARVASSASEQANSDKIAQAKQVLSHQEWSNIDRDYSALVKLCSAKPTTHKVRLPMSVTIAILAVSAVVAIALSILANIWVGVAVFVAGTLVVLLTKKTVVVDSQADIDIILHKYLPPTQCDNIDSAVAQVFAIRDKVHTARATITALGDSVLVASSGDKDNLVQLEHSIESSEGNIDRLSTSIGALTADIASIYQQSNVAELSDQLVSAKEQWQIDNYRYNIVTSLQGIITNTKKQMSLSYLPQLSSSTTQLLDNISSGRWQQVAISDKFELTMSEQGIMRELKYFSCGTRELVLFCYRVALSIKLYGDKLPLLLVDDAFVNLDDDKFRLALGVLEQLATQQGTQIVYVSCHNRRHR